MTRVSDWRFVCPLDAIVAETGVGVDLDGRQLAVFHVEGAVYALDNLDPACGANVLSRGIVGEMDGERVVASPMYKHHYSLITGRCLDDATLSVSVYPARIRSGRVSVCVQPLSRRQRPGKRRLVVVGNGMAGMRAVEELLAVAPRAYDITVFGSEPHGNYNRILLSPVLAGEKTAEEIVINPLDWYREQGITLHVGDPVVAIDRPRRVVRSASGVESHYDRLLLATGSNPIVLPVPGHDLPGVVTFRDLQDVDAMLRAAGTYRHAVVIGGGLLGLEAANGLNRQGMSVTVLHLPDTLMERQLDKVAGALLRQSLESRGLAFRMEANTAAIVGGDRVTAVRLADGSSIPADLVVMAAGIRPNIGLAKQAGLHCERGILVNDTMQTFDPAIYAVGECVQHRKSTYGLVAPLWEQARVCALHLAEMGMSRYRGSMVSTQLKVTGIDLFSAGDFVGGAGSEALVFKDARRGIYKRVVVADNKVLGAVLYGDTRDASWYFELMTEGRDVGPLRDTLLFGPRIAGPGIVGSAQ